MTPADVERALDDADTLAAIWGVTRAYVEPKDAAEATLLQSTFYCGARAVIFLLIKTVHDEGDDDAVVHLIDRLRAETRAVLGDERQGAM